MTGRPPADGHDHTSLELSRVAVGDDLAVEVLREQIAPNASVEELIHFGRVCTVLDLSPWAGQIVLIGRYDRRVGHEIFKPQITVDGRRARAERTGRLDGIDGPRWCGPRLDGELIWRDVWDDDDNWPYCARTLVYRKDWSRPANGTAKWNEFAQYVPAKDGGGKQLSPFWVRMPSHMLGKVSESLALRRAFPDDAAYRLAAVYAGDDTASTIIEAAGAAADPGDDRGPPVSYYDQLPEATGDADRPYRYDPDPGRPFPPDPNPGERFVE